MNVDEDSWWERLKVDEYTWKVHERYMPNSPSKTETRFEGHFWLFENTKESLELEAKEQQKLEISLFRVTLKGHESLGQKKSKRQYCPRLLGFKSLNSY